MRKRIFSLFCLLLSVLTLVSAVGCKGLDPAPYNEKVRELLSFFVERDGDRAYSLLYPDSMDKQEFEGFCADVYEYFPITEGYELDRITYDLTKSFTSSKAYFTAEYWVRFSGQAFHLAVAWVCDEGGDGFTRFNVLNEADYNSTQNN